MHEQMTTEVLATKGKEPTMGDQLSGLKERSAAGEDITNEARALQIALFEHQSSRIQFGIQITEEGFFREQEFSQDLEDLLNPL